MWLIYDLIIHLYGDTLFIASLFNSKAKSWVVGRKSIFKIIESSVGSRQSAVGGQRSAVGGRRSGDYNPETEDRRPETGDRRLKTGDRRPETGDRRPETVAWFHCASLGEFEQGRPVIEAFRKEHPDWKIVLTFFSPSGYEVRKNYEGADFIFYLPLDTPSNARKFITLIRPSLVIFVKYEFWFRYMDVLYREKIPVYVISAIFRKNQHFFKFYGGWALRQLRKVTGFFVQDQESAELLRAKGIGQVVVSGDTRFDRVAAIAHNAKPFPLVEKFAGGTPVFLAGSTWPADEELILKLIDETGGKMKFIIAPHEVHGVRIEALREKVGSRQSAVGSQAETRNPEPETILFSELTPENAASANVLIVDGIGYLSHLYQYATIAYIGGGFGVGIHNILEAATFGKTVIFGPNYKKFREAVDLIEAGGAFSISDSQQLNNRTIELLDNQELLTDSSEISSAYVQRNKGATGIILSSVRLKKS